VSKILHFFKKHFESRAEVLRLFRPYRRSQIVLLALSVAGLLLGLLNPYFSKLVIDEAIMKKNVGAFIFLGCATTGIYLGVGLLKAWIDLLERRMKLDVRLDLNEKVFGHLQRLPYSFFQGHSTGENMYRIYYDINQAVELAVMIPREIVNGFPRLVFTLGILFWMDWQIACLTLILVPVLFIPNWVLLLKMRETWKALTVHSQGVFQFLGEKLSHIFIIKAFGKEGSELGKYLEKLRENISLELKTVQLQVFGTFFAGGCGRVMTGVIALFGCFQVMRGRITFGTLTAMLLYLQEFAGLQHVFSSFLQNVSTGLISWRRIDEIMKAQPFTAGLPLDREKGPNSAEIRFRNVSFAYVKDAPILENLNFEMPRGVLALVGPSGCGKTTILNLLLRMFEPGAGEILVRGWDAKGASEEAFRGHISAAFQEPFLWDASVEENIRYGKEDATQQEMLDAARLALVDEVVRKLPMGYATVIGENACKISEGQKQKIAIARALIKDPKVLILDEAMAAMDSLSEEKILGNLKAHKKDMTVILVSHRLSTVMHADIVYYMKSPGEIKADTPSSMLRRDSDLAVLFSGQKA